MNFKKMPIAEIRECVSSGKIDLFSLSKKELQIIFDKEMEEQCRHKEYDMTLLNQCSEAFSRLDKKKFGTFWNKKYTARDFYELSIGKNAPESAAEQTVSTHMPMRRRMFVAIAAAILALGILGIGIAAYFNPFSIFGVSIKDLFNMNGGEISVENGDLYVPNSSSKYDTIEELSKYVGFDILHPSDNTEYNISSISLSEYDGLSHVLFTIKIEDYPEIECDINYGDKINEYYDEAQIASEYEAYDWNGYNVYYVPMEDSIQAMLYYGDKVYLLFSDTKENIEQYLSQIDTVS